jgi:hypothetical protein
MIRMRTWSQEGELNWNKNTRLINFGFRYEFLTILYINLQFYKNLFLKCRDKERLKLFLKVKPYTLVGYERLNNAYDLAKNLDVDGCIVECGCWKGGCVAVMGYVSKRKVWAFDSFEGFPEPEKVDGETARIIYKYNKHVVSIQDVKAILHKLNLKNVNIIKGWFEETLPKTHMGKIALLRLDNDWYRSTKFCLETLYDDVVKGGYVIIDDYGALSGAKKAVDEFIKDKNINLVDIDGIGVYWKK